MEKNLAVLIDFENIATGCEKEGLGRFDPRVIMRRLKDKGRLLVSRAYADWGRWSRFKMDLVHEGVTMVELTNHGMQSKNRADIALAVARWDCDEQAAFVRAIRALRPGFNRQKELFTLLDEIRGRDRESAVELLSALPDNVDVLLRDLRSRRFPKLAEYEDLYQQKKASHTVSL